MDDKGIAGSVVNSALTRGTLPLRQDGANAAGKLIKEGFGIDPERMGEQRRNPFSLWKKVATAAAAFTPLGILGPLIVFKLLQRDGEGENPDQKPKTEIPPLAAPNRMADRLVAGVGAAATAAAVAAVSASPPPSSAQSNPPAVTVAAEPPPPVIPPTAQMAVVAAVDTTAFAPTAAVLPPATPLPVVDSAPSTAPSPEKLKTIIVTDKADLPKAIESGGIICDISLHTRFREAALALKADPNKLNQFQKATLMELVETTGAKDLDDLKAMLSKSQVSLEGKHNGSLTATAPALVPS